MHHDTDPTPAHGTPRPTKSHALDRHLAHLRNQRAMLQHEVNDTTSVLALAQARLDLLDEDINTIEQLLIDMFPEPRD